VFTLTTIAVSIYYHTRSENAKKSGIKVFLAFDCL